MVSIRWQDGRILLRFEAITVECPNGNVRFRQEKELGYKRWGGGKKRYSGFLYKQSAMNGKSYRDYENKPYSLN